MKANIEVFDKNRKRLAILDKAYNIGYTKERNRLSMAEFTLKIDDDKNQYCKPFHYIKLYEAGEYIDMFVIMPLEMVKDSHTKEITYYCEHVLGSLLNTSLFRYHEIGGIGTYTDAIIKFLLNKQSDWVLGACDFRRQFQYSWENENLLSALFSIPNEFDEEYSFTWDTTVYPWVINLVRPSYQVKANLHYERNMIGVRKSEDGSAVCTRLYALGYGEGVNQLGINKLNPTGKPYIEADTINEYGIIEKIWCDRRYQVEENLFNAAKAKLEILKRPKVTYEIEAAELWALTKITFDKFDEGDIVRVIDKEAGIDVATRIVKKSKSNIEQDYISASIEISSEVINSAAGLTDLYKRAEINETNSQGATNINNYNFYGNCDAMYPAKLRFKIPDEAVNINKVELSFQSDAFRAYSKANVSAQSSTSGASSQQSSGASSRNTSGSSSRQTSASSSKRTTDQSNRTSSGASSSSTTENARERITVTSTTYTPNPTYNLGSTFELSGEYRHSHGVQDHRHSTTIEGHTHDMRHVHDIDHEHGMDHYHDMDHNHSMDHTHNINHTHTIEGHNHEIVYGIYEGPSSSRFTVRVDGMLTTLTAIRDSFDIVQYLSKDDGGRIVRGWHEVLIYPDNLCRINADVMVQVFVNSRGGGNY